jgi:DNA-binding FadR family transcriptional regulator
MKSLLGLTKKVVEAVNPDPDYVHPRGMHRSVVEAVVTGNAEIAAEAMKKHTIDFGENFIKMERTYRERNSLTRL